MNTPLNQDNDNIEHHHSRVVYLFALVGMSITAVMSIIALFNNSIVLSAALFVASTVYAFVYFIAKKLNNLRLASSTILYSLYLLMFYLIYSGGVDNTGPLWIFIVSPVSLFLHGLKRGLIDISCFVIIICIIMFIPYDAASHASYSTNFKLRLLYSFLTVTFLSAVYENSRDKSYKKTLELSQKYQFLANNDPLTQLSNRRDALAILKQERARSLRSKEPLSIILCDVDHFKKVNDLYGHNAGDLILVELSNIFKTSKRAQDFVARWGGEEFLFILPQTSAQNASLLAEKIQNKIRHHSVSFQGKEIKITTSMGIEQFKQDSSIDETINNADKYLYQAKDMGRDKIYPEF